MINTNLLVPLFSFSFFILLFLNKYFSFLLQIMWVNDYLSHHMFPTSLQLNASDNLGLGQRTLERPPMLQQINGQINVGGASGSHFAANPIAGPVGLGNFSAASLMAPPPPPPVYYNIYGGPSFAAYPGFSAAMNMNQSINIPSFEGPLAGQYDIGSSSNNSNINNNNNYLYTDGNGLLMQRAMENDVSSAKPVRRCWNVKCNTTDTPMWRRGPFGPKV